jgi:hypothetical protein
LYIVRGACGMKRSHEHIVLSFNLIVILILLFVGFISDFKPVFAASSTSLTVEIRPSTASKGESVEFWSRLFDSSGQPVVGPTLKFYVSGSFIGSGSNPSTGWASFTYMANLNSGSYEIKVVFDGDSPYNSSRKSQTLTILQVQKTAEITCLATDKSSYNPNETVMVKVRNTGNTALSWLRVNVDIANPSGGNVKKVSSRTASAWRSVRRGLTPEPTTRCLPVRRLAPILSPLDSMQRMCSTTKGRPAFVTMQCRFTESITYL